MAEAAATDVVVADLDDEFWFERLRIPQTRYGRTLMTTNRSIHHIVVMSTVSAIAFFAGVGSRLAHAPGDIYNRGTLTYGATSVGYGINDAGQVAGPHGYGRAFRYDGTPGSGGAMADLGTLGGAYSVGIGINASGQVTGYAETIDDAYHAFRRDGTPGSGARWPTSARSAGRPASV